MASIYPRHNKNGTVTYRVVFRRKGLGTFCATMATEREAKEFAERYEKDFVLNGIRPSIDRLQNQRRVEFTDR